MTARWVSLDEAAKFLGVHKKTVTRMIERGELRGSRVGKRLIRIRSDDLENVLTPIEPSVDQRSRS